MKVGIFGLPHSGKSTVFRLLTGAEPSVRQEVCIGMAKVPDPRIDALTEMFHPKKTTYAQIETVDVSVAGLDAADKKNLNRLLAHVRKVDAMVFVVRTFESPDGEPANPVADAVGLMEELILADLAFAETRIERLSSSRRRSAEDDTELRLMEALASEFSNGHTMREINLDPEERLRLLGYGLLSVKPVVMVANMSEGQFTEGNYGGRQELRTYCAERGIPLVELAAKIEAELAELGDEDRKALMAEYGIFITGTAQIARAVYESLGYVSFFTVGEDEVRAWPIVSGTLARSAAGKIHSDIERGFIRAEAVGYDDLSRLGSVAKARSAGVYRLEGKDYVVKDGDILCFRFSPQR